MKDFIEQEIIRAVRELLAGWVNELLQDLLIHIPVIEFGDNYGNSSVVPVIALSTCERSEKERIIRQDAFSLTVTFTLQEHEDGELFCYAYSAAFEKALREDITLGSIADRAVTTEKKYIPPKKPGCGEGWGLVLSARVTVER